MGEATPATPATAPPMNAALEFSVAAVAVGVVATVVAAAAGTKIAGAVSLYWNPTHAMRPHEWGTLRLAGLPSAFACLFAFPGPVGLGDLVLRRGRESSFAMQQCSGIVDPILRDGTTT